MDMRRSVGIGMVGYKFMGKAHSHAYRDLPFYFDSGIRPVMSAIAGRDSAGVEQAARRIGWDGSVRIGASCSSARTSA